MVEYVDTMEEWRFIENDFHTMESSSKPQNWFENEEEESEEEEEEDEKMKESGECATAQSGGCSN